MADDDTTTPDWLQQYAQQQGWADAPAPDPQLVANAGPAPQPTPAPGASMVEGQHVAPGASMVEGHPAHVMAGFAIPSAEEAKQDAVKAWDALKATTGVEGFAKTEEARDRSEKQIQQKLGEAVLDERDRKLATFQAQSGATSPAITGYTPPPPPEQKATDQQQMAADQGEAQPAQPQDQPGYVIPGGWQRTVSPDVLAQRQGLEGQRDEALAQNEIDARLTNQKAAEFYAQQSAQLATQRDEQQKQLLIAQQAQAKAQNVSDAAQKEAENFKVDPDKFYGGIGGHILATIAAGFGAFGASLTHSPNFAAEQIKEGVNASLEAQKLDMHNKQGNAHNAYQRLLEATGSERAADSAFKQAGLQLAQSQAMELDAGAKDSALMAALRQAQAQEAQDNLNFHMATEKYAPPVAVGGGPAPSAGGQGAEADTENSFMIPEAMAGYPANTRFVATGKKSAEQLRNVVIANATIQGALKKIEALEKEHGQSIYADSSVAHAQAQAEINAMLGKVGALQGQSKLPIVDVEMWKNQLMPEGAYEKFAAATGLGSSLTDRVRAMADVADRETKDNLRTHAAEVAKRHLTVGPGGVTPGVHYTGEAIEKRLLPQSAKPLGVNVPYQAPADRTLTYNPEVRVQRAAPATGKGRGKKKAAASTSEEVAEPESDGEETE